MENAGRALVLIGCGILLLGLLLMFGDRLPLRLGRLPLDFRIDRKHFTLYIPLGTSLLLSALVSLVWFWLKR